MLAQRRLKWRLIIGFFLIVSIVAAKSDKKSFKNNQQKLAHQRLDEIQGSGQPPKSPGASVDDEITAPGSGKNPSPGASVDDEDSVPVIEGSGQPPKDIVKPSATSTTRPLTTTSTEPNELKIEDQEEDDLDEDDESDDETVDLEPVFKQAEPETTTLPITTSTSTTATPKQVFELMTRQPPTTTNAPTFPSQIDSVNLDMLRPGLLAAISGGAVVGLLLTILLVMFIVYRMRKKDEGSYSLDEQTNHHQPAHYSYAYQKAPTKEFYA